ncbi:MAG: hypothetical protein ACJ79P_24505 [Myxococcales bacterium]
MDKRTCIAAIFSFALATVAARADDGCSKDTDCKGERICIARACVNPNASVAPGNAVPASFDPATSAAQKPPAPITDTARPVAPVFSSTANRHLGGFVRPDLGLGYFSESASQNGVDASITGAAGSFGIAVGGAVAENHILAFHFWDVVATSPSVSAGNVSVSNADATVTLIAFGPEYTAYSRENLYFSISPALTRATISSNGSSADTNWGFGLRTGVGKEWWVSDHWGLGVAGHLSLSMNEDTGNNPPTWTGWSATIAFSATYN